MRDIEEKITEMNRILKTAEEQTPRHIKGLLIPDYLLCKFEMLIESFMRSAKFEWKYYDYIRNSANESQKAVTEFMEIATKAIAEGRLKFNTKEAETELE